MIKQTALSALMVLSLSACAYDIDSSKMTSTNSMLQAMPELPPSNLNIGLENIDALNKEAVSLGKLCSGHTYNMKTGNDLTQRLTDADKDGSLDTPEKPDLRVVAASSSSTLKCVMTSPISGKCQAKVDISGEIIPKNSSAKPFNISKSSIMPTYACEGATKSLRTANAEAVDEIVDMVRALDK